VQERSLGQFGQASFQFHYCHETPMTVNKKELSIINLIIRIMKKYVKLTDLHKLKEAELNNSELSTTEGTKIKGGRIKRIVVCYVVISSMD
jgi:hypothetical protein